MTTSTYTPARFGPLTGATTTFPFAFKVLDPSHLVVTRVAADGSETVLVSGTDYSATGFGTDAGGSVVTTATYADGYLVISREVPITQTTKLRGQSAFYPEIHEDAFDKLTMIAQQQLDELGRSLKLPIGSTEDPALPAPVEGTLLGWVSGKLANLAAATASLAANLLSSAANMGTALITYMAPFAGAVARALRIRLGDFASVKDFGAVGDGITDDTAAIQTAINSGKSITFPEGVYLAHALVGTTNFQRFFAHGRVVIQKNASGHLWTTNANYVEFHGLNLKDYSAYNTYTGDGFQFNGYNNRLVGCGASGHQRRAVLSSGTIQILGCCDVYQTGDPGGGAYDIEIGTSGTATLYSTLMGVKTGWSSGGIKFVDCGSQMVSDCQFGKYYIQAGTKPSGVNGGTTVGCRITGTTIVDMSSAMFAANQFDAVAITFSAGTSQCSLGTSNSFSTATVVNNGNANNLIQCEVSSGSTSQVRYGDSSSAAVTTTNIAGNEQTFSGSFGIASGKVYKVNSVQVVAARRTGWAAWSGSANRATKNTSTATLADVSQTLAALLDDLIAHGLIGA